MKDSAEEHKASRGQRSLAWGWDCLCLLLSPLLCSHLEQQIWLQAVT